MQQDRFRERQQLISILKFSMHCAAAEAISCSEQKDDLSKGEYILHIHIYSSTNFVTLSAEAKIN